jgi:hypothetical protein
VDATAVPVLATGAAADGAAAAAGGWLLPVALLAGHVILTKKIVS